MKIQLSHFSALFCLLFWSGGTAAVADDYRALSVLRPTARSADEHPPVITALAFHPQGNILASAGDDHTIRIWDLQQEKVLVILRGHDDWVRGLCFTEDGHTLASVGADGKLFLWDFTNRRRHLAIDREKPLSSVALAHDRTHLVVTGFENAVYTVDIESHQTVSRVTCKCDDLRTVDTSPDGKWLASGGRDGNVYVWSTVSGQLMQTIPAHGRRIRAIRFSTDGKQLITGGEDRAVCVWDLKTGEEVMHLDTQRAKVLALCVLPNNRVASSGSDNTIRIWDLQLRTELSRIEGHTGSIAALATDGERLASGGFDTTVRIWAVPKGDRVETANQEQPAER